MLKQSFQTLLKSRTENPNLQSDLWTEIQKKHSNKKRHYHTLTHLENLLNQLLEVKPKIKNWNTILFTLFYHDIIYNAIKSNNEEKSAELAKKRMKQIGVSDEEIDRCTAQILATKSHQVSSDSDTNYFTDADLSILGMNWETYAEYAKNVRKEYAIYPDAIYNPGRKKVLQHFLEMDRIYKTDYFFDKFEKQAKLNMEEELNLLNS